HELLVKAHESSVEPISRFLRRVERLRNAALHALAGRRWRASKGSLLIPELLGSLEVYVAVDDEAAWCTRYLSQDLSTARREVGLADGAPTDVDACVELLRHGYVTLA